MTLEVLHNFWGSQEGRSRARKSIYLLMAGVILTLLIPLSSYGVTDFITSASYWMSHVLILMAVSGFIARLIFPYFLKRKSNSIWAVVQYAALTSLPVYFVAVAYELAVGGASYQVEGALGEFVTVRYGEMEYLQWFVETYIYTLIIIGGLSLAAAKFSISVAPSKPKAGQLFFNRLSPELGTDLLCLAMEDHYIRVHTKLGNELIHLRMADAVAELAGYPGFQVHRSWWVAAGAIAHISKEQRKYTARLENGLAVPISRNRVDELKAGNFL